MQSCQKEKKKEVRGKNPAIKMSEQIALKSRNLLLISQNLFENSSSVNFFQYGGYELTGLDLCGKGIGRV